MIYTTGPSVMMMLGSFQFSIKTAAYQELSRTTEWRWPSQDRFMQEPALQFVGKGADTITLPGVIYPEYRGGLGQINAMRSAADAGEPLNLIDGEGVMMGRWVIERVDERQMIFAAGGIPRKQEFTLALRKFDEPEIEPVSIVESVVASAASTVGGVPPTSASGVVAFAKSAASTISVMATNISAALGEVQAVASEIGALANDVLAPIYGAARTANQLQQSLNDAQRLVGMRPTNISGLASLNKIVNSAASASANAGQFSNSLARASENVKAIPGIASSAVKAVENSVVAVNKMTVAATSIQSKASDGIKNLTAS